MAASLGVDRSRGSPQGKPDLLNGVAVFRHRSKVTFVSGSPASSSFHQEFLRRLRDSFKGSIRRRHPPPDAPEHELANLSCNVQLRRQAMGSLWMLTTKNDLFSKRKTSAAKDARLFAQWKRSRAPLLVMMVMIVLLLGIHLTARG